MLNLILIFMIKAIRPLLGYIGHCKYEISCYDYGIYQLKNYSLIKAIYKTSQRVLSCNPFN